MNRRRRRPDPPARSSIALDRADLTAVAIQAAAGDEAARRSFVQRTMDDVWRYCAHVLGPQQADDATQATYVRALRSLHRFRADSSAKTWLIGVAHHVCLDEIRSRGRRDRIVAKVSSQPIDGAAHRDLGLVDYQDLLSALEPTRRDAFVLTQVLGLPYAEAAEIVGCPVGTVRSRVSRARSDLMEMLADADEDLSTGTDGSSSIPRG